ESYDPDRTALRTARTTKEEMTGAKPPGGAPGAQANLTNESGGADNGASHSQRKDESTSYEVSKIVSRTVGPVGALKQLSVAVLIDGTYAEANGKRTFTPRPQEELDRLRDLVKSAIGLTDTRGDKID